MCANVGILLLNLLITLVYSSELSDVNYYKIRKNDSFRLPNDTKPLSYDLKISTNIHKNDFDFSGVIDIRLIVLKPTDRVVVHVKGLNIEQISLTDLTRSALLEQLQSEYDDQKSLLTVFSKLQPFNLIPDNQYILRVIFNGTLSSTELTGFYRTSYSGLENSTIWIATTQFEPTYARQAFPCYDEPQLKANFTITLTHGSNYSAISNMPPDGEPSISEDGIATTKFMQTPLMSTYNIAFVIFNFEHNSAEMDNITQIVYYPPGSESKGESALNTALKTLHELQNYFNVSYPLPKIDHFEVPQRFGQAMENWGLIIYRKPILLSNMGIKSLDMKYTGVITHEIAHQWFGNLVTLKWWTYVWLNEGLATHYGNKAIQLIYPKWNSNDYIMATELRYSWDDNYEKPITQYVESEEEIQSAFSGATYCKAAYVLQMFEHALTEKTFQKGVSIYLKKFQYSVTEEDDFFNALQQAATDDSVEFFKEDGTVQRTIKTWTKQKFHPLVTVSRIYENGTFTLHQMPFPETEKEDYFWNIPITYMTKSDPDLDRTAPDIMFPAVSTIYVNPASFKRKLLPDDWLILNKKQIGFYRVNYDELNWQLIIEALKKDPKTIHSHNRAQLIRDVGSLLLHNQLNASIAFELFTYLEYEDESVPWQAALDTLFLIFHELEDTENYQLYKQFTQDLIRKKFRTTVLNIDEQHLPLDEIVSTTMFKFACTLELNDCLQYARNMFESVFNGTTKIDKRIEKIIFCEGLKKAAESVYKTVCSQLSRTEDESKRTMLIECLASTQDSDLVNYLLESTVNRSSIKLSSKEKTNLMIEISENSVGLPILLQFLRDNHRELVQTIEDLWSTIAFLEYQIRSEEEKLTYIKLLEDGNYLEKRRNFRSDEIFVKDYPEFHNQQQEFIAAWLKGYVEKSSSSNVKVKTFEEKPILQRTNESHTPQSLSFE